MRRLLAVAPLAIVMTLAGTTLAAPPARVAQSGAAKSRGTKKAPKKKVEAPAPVEEPVAKAAPIEEPVAKPAPPPPAPRVAPPGEADADASPKAAEEIRPISVAPIFGYATNHANLGIGVRGGYTLPQHIYIGGTFVYHFGTSTDVPTLRGGTITSSVHLLYPGAEVGYDIAAGPVVVRPYGGVGVLVALASTSGGGGEGASDSSTSLAFWPGCTVSYDIPRSPVFVGGDVRVLIATKGGDPSLGMFGTAGLRF